MAREKITRYVIDKYKEGYTFEKIKESLVKSNFSPELVDQVIHEVKINDMIDIIEKKKEVGYKEEAIKKLLETFGYSSEDIKKATEHSRLNEKAKHSTKSSDEGGGDGFLDLDDSGNSGVQTISYSVNKTSQENPVQEEMPKEAQDSQSKKDKDKDKDKEESQNPNETEKSTSDSSAQNSDNQTNKSDSVEEKSSSENTSSSQDTKISSTGPSFFDSIKNKTKKAFDAIKNFLGSIDFSSLKKLNAYHYMIIGFVFITIIVSVIFVLIDFEDEPEVKEPELPHFSLDAPKTELRPGSLFNYSVILDEPPEEDGQVIIEFSIVCDDTGETVLSKRDTSNILSLEQEEFSFSIDENIPPGNYTLKKVIFDNVKRREFEGNFTVEKSYEELCEDCPEGQVCFEGSCCEPETCITLGYECGKADDGCGTELDCGDCLDGEVCQEGRCVGEAGSCKNNETVTWTDETEEGSDCGPVSFGDRYTVEGETKEVNYSNDYRGEATFECIEGSWEFVEGSCLEPDYNLFIEVEGEGTTTPEFGLHRYFEGETVEITAEAADGWEFEGFDGDCSGSSCSLVMDEDKEVSVTFVEEPEDCDMEVTVSWSDGSSTGNDCGPVSFGEGMASHGQEETVSFSEDEYDGSATYECFDGSWDFIEGTCDVECTRYDHEKCYDGDVYWYDSCGNKDTVSAICSYGCEDGECLEEEIEYTLSIDITGQGTTSPETGSHTYGEGEPVEITAEAADGWEFKEWTGDCSGSGDCEVTMDEDKQVNAVFEEEEVDEYELEIVVDGEGSTDPQEGTHKYEEGENVVITAEAEDGWEFKEWTGDCSGSGDCEVTMDEDKQVNAVFEEEEVDEYELEIGVDGEGSTDPQEGTHKYEEGENVLITAEAEDGWEFKEWTGDCSGSGDCEVTMDEDKQVTAVFVEEVDEYELDVSVEDESEGSTDPEEGTYTYNKGETVLITAIPGDGWEFKEWDGEGSATECDGKNEKDCTFTINEDSSLKAHFIEIEENGEGED